MEAALSLGMCWQVLRLGLIELSIDGLGSTFGLLNVTCIDKATLVASMTAIYPQNDFALYFVGSTPRTGSRAPLFA